MILVRNRKLLQRKVGFEIGQPVVDYISPEQGVTALFNKCMIAVAMVSMKLAMGSTLSDAFACVVLFYYSVREESFPFFKNYT